MRTLALISVLALAGCATPYTWQHSHNDRGRFDADANQCLYEATSATASYSSGGYARTYRGALALGIGEAIAITTRQNELIVLCMKARGYTIRSVTS